MSEEFNEDREDEAVSGSSPLEEARKRIDLALIDIKENNSPLERFPCTLFSECGFKFMSDQYMKIILSANHRVQIVSIKIYKILYLCFTGKKQPSNREKECRQHYLMNMSRPEKDVMLPSSTAYELAVLSEGTDYRRMRCR